MGPGCFWGSCPHIVLCSLCGSVLVLCVCLPGRQPACLHPYVRTFVDMRAMLRLLCLRVPSVRVCPATRAAHTNSVTFLCPKVFLTPNLPTHIARLFACRLNTHTHTQPQSHNTPPGAGVA